MKSEWKPWEWYPDIWATEAKFWVWLRGSLRRAVWNKSPIKITFKNGVCKPPPEGYNGKAKSGAYCALSGKWEGKSKLEIDHISGNVSLKNEEDILGFIQHLIPPPDSLQAVTKEAHKIKSYSESRGLDFKEAVAIKKAIHCCNTLTIEAQKDLLKSYGYEDKQIANQKQRRTCFEEYYLKEVGK